jgi:hypothetical protein
MPRYLVTVIKELTMAQFVCVSCGRRGNIDDRVQWYEGSARGVLRDPDEAAVEEGAFLCGDCFVKLDPEEKPRWKPVSRTRSFDKPTQ